MRKKRYNLFKQKDSTDCGVACLATIIQYFGGTANLEELKTRSGTSIYGTTLLGLHQTSSEIGLKSEAFTAEVSHLKSINTPCILHVVMDNKLQHFVVYYGFKNNKFIIGDPAQGLIFLEEKELIEIWKTKTLLILEPNDNFKVGYQIAKEKWEWVYNLTHSDIPFLIMSVLIGIIVALLGLSIAVFSQKLIDQFLPNSEQDKIYVGLTILGCLLLFKNLLNWLRGYLLIWQSKEFNNRIINTFYSLLLFLPKYFFDSRKTGELVTRMNDTRRIQSTISSLAGTVMTDVLIVLVSSVFLFYYSAWIGLTATGAILLFLMLSLLLSRKIAKEQKAVMQAYAVNESNYIDTIQGVDVIKVYGKQSLFSSRTSAIYGRLQDKTFTLGKTSLGYGLFAECIGVAFMISVLLLMSHFVLNGSYKVGELVAVISISGGIIPAISRLSVVNIQLQEAKVAFDRMYEFVKIEPEENTETKNQVTTNFVFQSLSVKTLSFRFSGRQLLLKDISFGMKKGEMIALLGESGTGKSTTLQILQRFYTAEKGKILVNENALEDISLNQWRRMLGVVPQQIKIFNGSLAENICLDNPMEKFSEMVSFCEKFGFHDFFNAMPQSYATILGEGGINLSGGQQQLVALARALFSKPQLLMLDEPTSAMDRNTERFILNLLMRLKEEGMAVLMVTHKINTARRADRIYVMEQGEIVTYGNHDSLISGKNLYSDTWADYV